MKLNYMHLELDLISISYIKNNLEVSPQTSRQGAAKPRVRTGCWWEAQLHFPHILMVIKHLTTVFFNFLSGNK